ncbi:MAG TPA: crosslink repair DNA glycosylase YcaQ family protein [Alphaproteobacteria bacterium]|nr:crosslink repair DNA glycosylase YcaQ family protein [Alphaproteobacteria bacterium]
MTAGSTSLPIGNAEARRLFLERHALARPPRAALDREGLRALIHDLGFVQLDSINTVERAHHLILFSRADGYRREELARLHGREAALFEHWTHDASLIPVEFFPHWHHRFRENRARTEHPRWRQRLGPDGETVIRAVRQRVRSEGPLMARDFDDAHKGEGAWWGWGPSKTALEYLWRSGELAIAGRNGFAKVYDLTERVIPAEHREHRPDRAETVDWACRAALQRLGFATPGELAAFWGLVSPAEATRWAEAARRGGILVPVAIEGVDGARRGALAFADIEDRLAAVPAPPARLRFLSPFDPAIRDRRRGQRLFGFDYRIEVFVPAAKRRYGYYVLPILEGERFTGRADLKAHRQDGRLELKALWLEPGVTLGSGREQALRQALARLARFTGVETVDADRAIASPRRA